MRVGRNNSVVVARIGRAQNCNAVKSYAFAGVFGGHTVRSVAGIDLRSYVAFNVFYDNGRGASAVPYAINSYDFRACRLRFFVGTFKIRIPQKSQNQQIFLDTCVDYIDGSGARCVGVCQRDILNYYERAVVFCKFGREYAG